MRLPHRCLMAAALLALTPDARTPAQPPTAPDPKAKAADADLLLGTWAIVGLETGGKAEPERNYTGNTLRFARDRFPVRVPAVLGYKGAVRFTLTRDRAVLREGGYPPIDFAVTLDPGKAPKTIDLTTKGAALRGIYRLDGDDLTLCVGIGGPRPADFTTRPEMPAEAFTLRRVWERHAGAGLGFSAEFPLRPEQRVRKADTPTGPTTTTFFVARGKADRLTYVVAVTPLRGKLAGAELERGLDAARAAVATEAAGPGKVTAEGDTDFKGPGGYAGREVVLAIEGAGPAEKAVVRVRAFVAGDRLYALAVAGTPEAAKAATVTRFWNSFRLTDAKKEPPTKNR